MIDKNPARWIKSLISKVPRDCVIISRKARRKHARVAGRRKAIAYPYVLIMPYFARVVGYTKEVRRYDNQIGAYANVNPYTGEYAK